MHFSLIFTFLPYNFFNLKISKEVRAKPYRQIEAVCGQCRPLKINVYQKTHWVFVEAMQVDQAYAVTEAAIVETLSSFLFHTIIYIKY